MSVKTTEVVRTFELHRFTSECDTVRVTTFDATILEAVQRIADVRGFYPRNEYCLVDPITGRMLSG